MRRSLSVPCSLVSRPNLHQPALPRTRRLRLRRPPMVDVTDPVHAPYRAIRRATLGGEKLPLHVGRCVLANRNPRVPALLAAVVHQPVLADIQVPRPRPAPPLVRPPLRNRSLKLVELR